MVEKPQTDKETNDTPTITPDLPVGASSKSEEHTRALLGAYQDTLDVAEDLPAIVWLRLRENGLGRLIKLPHLRWFLRYFLTDHIRRGLGLLNRRFHATAALTSDSKVNQAARTAVEHYLQALPPPPYKRLGLAVLLTVLAVALPQRSLGLGDPTPILNFGTNLVVRMDPQGAMQSFASTTTGEELEGVVGLLLTLFVMGFLPASTFALKRLLFNLYPGAKERLGSIGARDYVFSVEGLYTLEDRTFGEFGSRRPKEFPFDLLFRVLVLVLLGPPLIVFIALLPMVLFTALWSMIASAVLAILLITGFVVRLRQLLIAWRKRNRPSELPPADHRDSPLHHGAEDAERNQRAGRRTYALTKERLEHVIQTITHALAREKLEQVTQTIDPFPPLRTKKSPRLAFVLGFLFNGVGLGIYFRSWVDLIVPSIASIVWLMLTVALHHSGLWIGVLAIGGLWGLLRTVSSNERQTNRNWRPPPPD
jgi:hypothetical protein